MINWASSHADILQVATAMVTAVVWVVYLHLIHSNLRRRRRSYVMINIGGARGFDASCFIANIGLEPVYVSDVVLTFTIDGQCHDALLTDRAELRWNDLPSPADATIEGPLGSNEQVSIGTFGQLLQRASFASSSVDEADIETVERFEVAAILSTAAGSGIVGARREFEIGVHRGAQFIFPNSLETRQLRSGRDLRRLAQRWERTRCHTS